MTLEKGGFVKYVLSFGATEELQIRSKQEKQRERKKLIKCYLFIFFLLGRGGKKSFDSVIFSGSRGNERMNEWD